VLKNAPFPVLFIIGKDDTSVPLQQSLQECALPAESMVCFLGHVGHMGMIESSDKSIAFTEQFIAYCLNTLNK
jgi:pimeloyl-ACP methyl ester carboxylesterase